MAAFLILLLVAAVLAVVALNSPAAAIAFLAAVGAVFLAIWTIRRRSRS